MIQISREDKKILFKVEHNVFHNDRFFTLEIDRGTDLDAELLREAFQKNLNRHLADLKQKYYDLGWQQAKAKKGPKRTDFYGGWEK